MPPERTESLSTAGDTVVAEAVEPAFNEAQALARFGGDRVFLCSLALIFMEEAQSMIADIRAAVELQDGRRLERAAHKLKGSAYPLCATAVTESAQALESIGASGNLADATADFLRFETEILRLLRALSALHCRAEAQGSLNADVPSAGAIECKA